MPTMNGAGGPPGRAGGPAASTARPLTSALAPADQLRRCGAGGGRRAPRRDAWAFSSFASLRRDPRRSLSRWRISPCWARVSARIPSKATSARSASISSGREAAAGVAVGAVGVGGQHARQAVVDHEGARPRRPRPPPRRRPRARRTSRRGDQPRARRAGARGPGLRTRPRASPRPARGTARSERSGTWMTRAGKTGANTRRPSSSVSRSRIPRSSGRPARAISPSSKSMSWAPRRRLQVGLGPVRELRPQARAGLAHGQALPEGPGAVGAGDELGPRRDHDPVFMRHRARTPRAGCSPRATRTRRRRRAGPSRRRARRPCGPSASPTSAPSP